MRSVQQYLTEVQEVLNHLPIDQLDNIIEVLLQANATGTTIFTMGNGGSASTASHMAGDLAKGTITQGCRRFRVIALTDNLPQLTAWSNDTDYSEIFREQLRNLMNPGDIVIAISGSGNSANVLKAVEYANQIGGTTIGFCGFKGGQLSRLVHYPVVVPSDCMEQIEDVHMVISHLMAVLLREKLQSTMLPSECVEINVPAYLETVEAS